VAFSPDGRRIVSGSIDGALKVWDAESGQETLTLKGHTDQVASVAFSPDGLRIVSGGGTSLSSELSLSGELKLWDATSRQEKLPGNNGQSR
jgi:WD40 repeat protein